MALARGLNRAIMAPSVRIGRAKVVNPRERNQRVIEEFRANGGKVTGTHEGRPILLLTTTGAKSGRPYTTPVMYLRDGDRLAVFATHGGSPKHPDWYANLVANPTVTV